MARKVAAALGGSLRGKTIALLGLTFKADTDDMREAPSITLSTALSDMHASIRAYDPVGMEQAKGVLPPGITCCSSAYEAAANADALVVVTEWGEFRKLDFDRLKMVMRAPVIIDLRNIYRVEELAPYGFRYYRIGAPQLSPAVPLNARPAETPAPRAMPAKAIRPHANGNGGRQSPRRRSGLVASERKEFASLS